MVSVLWSVLYKWSTRHRYLAIYTGGNTITQGHNLLKTGVTYFS